MKYTKQPLTSRVSSLRTTQRYSRKQRQILLVEDNQALHEQLSFLLEDLGVVVHAVGTLAEAREFFATQRVELVILDRGLPDGDGLELLKDIDTTLIPTLILSAKQEVTERIKGLRLGATEYLAKPFSREELKLRIQRMIELKYGVEEHVLQDAAFCFTPQTGQVSVENHTVDLPRREAQVLTTLLRHSGHVLSKSQIIQQIWQHQVDQPNDETIEVYVRRLRQRLPSAVRDRLVTVRGYGYRYQAVE